MRLAQRTDSLRLWRALAAGAVYYDPGIKLENASTDKAKSKKRSQFRVASRNIGALYETVEMVEVRRSEGKHRTSNVQHPTSNGGGHGR
ncbi:MAG: MvaI/BcnI family restriction endonuclease [Verrucomicrobia bacterium]|nr:MvaI/BcnI family restriction endonuclease [Verrucomicrobiota bacterium]